jgi:cytochrome oxidase Cu insertion factor (SCO1/SenC/PrrC family)
MTSRFTVALLCAVLLLSGCGETTSSKVSEDETSEPEAKLADSGRDETAAADSEVDSEPRVLGEVPPFELIDQEGEPFDKSNLDGKIWVATFIFTRCGATCPMQTSEMGKLQKYLRSSGDLERVDLASFTVDPAYDKPDVLKEYGRNADADFDHWHFLTGDRAALWDLGIEGFNVQVQSGRDSEQIITHSQFLILVDRESKIRGYYPALSFTATQKLRKDLEWLLSEQYPNRDDQVTEISEPEDVRDPSWLADRAQSQIEAAKNYPVNCDFKFSDEIESSQITFKQNVVDDVKRLFKFAHYDHGTGVAVADVDGDELLDVYFVNQLGPNELWKNNGDGTFTDITEQAGVAVPEEVGIGASFADVDNDGDADLYVTRIRSGNRLFRNDGSGTFEDISEASGLDHVGHSSGAVFFDYDRDGLLDLLLTNVGKYTVDQRGPGGYYFADKAAFSGHLHDDRHEASVLFHNEGDCKFRDVNEEVGFNDLSWSGDASPIDANEDGWPDIYLLNMQGHDEYYENQQGKGFVKRSRELFPASAWGTMGIKVFDYNRDGQLDLYVTDMHTDMVHDLGPDEEKSKMRRNSPPRILATDGNHVLGNTFYEKVGPDEFREVSDEINAENYWPWGISVADLNADGFEDVFIAASMSYPYRYGINSVLLNDHGKRFLDSEFVLGVEPRSKGTAQPWMTLDCSGRDADHHLCENRRGKLVVWGAIGTRSSVIFDIENDGDLDIVTSDFGGTPMVLVSDLEQRQEIHFLKIKLVGNESNRDGLGAHVTVHAGESSLLSVHDGKSGYLSQSRKPLYFGLAEQQQVDRIEVDWPSGTRQVVEGPIEANQTLTITEAGKE